MTWLAVIDLLLFIIEEYPELRAKYEQVIEKIKQFRAESRDPTDEEIQVLLAEHGSIRSRLETIAERGTRTEGDGT